LANFTPILVGALWTNEGRRALLTHAPVFRGGRLQDCGCEFAPIHTPCVQTCRKRPMLHTQMRVVSVVNMLRPRPLTRPRYAAPLVCGAFPRRALRNFGTGSRDQIPRGDEAEGVLVADRSPWYETRVHWQKFSEVSDLVDVLQKVTIEQTFQKICRSQPGATGAGSCRGASAGNPGPLHTALWPTST